MKSSFEIREKWTFIFIFIFIFVDFFQGLNKDLLGLSGNKGEKSSSRSEIFVLWGRTSLDCLNLPRKEENLGYFRGFFSQEKVFRFRKSIIWRTTSRGSSGEGVMSALCAFRARVLKNSFCRQVEKKSMKTLEQICLKNALHSKKNLSQARVLELRINENTERPERIK